MRTPDRVAPLALSLALLAGAVVLAPAAGLADAAPPVVHHAARLTLDPATHQVAVRDTLLVPAGLDTFTLLEPLFIGYVAWAHDEETGSAQHRDFASGEVVDVGEEPTYRAEALPGDGRAEPDGRRRVIYHYGARLHQPTDQVTFSRERVGGEITATVGEEGVWLSGRARWLPTFEDALSTCRLTIETPAGLIPVTNGVRVSQEEADGKLVTVYEAIHPADGIDLIANAYTVSERQHGDVAIGTYLLQPDRRLSDLYLERTDAYLDLYEGLFGEYPFGKFSTVENWFPTGYGMPGWTLLGSMVMRLPFIPYTSFGHEVCHNWWGNSVMVGEGGNWCEGLTVYFADYLYKQQESDADARGYRRNLLKDYAAYVGAGAGAPPAPAVGPAGTPLPPPAEAGPRDFPLVDFESRHSGATRAIGYGKSMMVWHMLDRLVGHEAFLAALRRIYDEKRYRPATWDDFLAAIAAEGDVDLTEFRREWLERAGAPALSLLEAARDGDDVRLVIAQDEPVYHLPVPVLLQLPDGPEERIVELDGRQGEFAIEAPGATRVAVDPDYHLFRRLDPGEIEPTISEVLGAEVPLFVLPAGDSTLVEAARAFARDFTETETPMTVRGGMPPADGKAEHTPQMVLLDPQADYLRDALPRDVAVSGDTVILEGRRHSLQEYDLVLALRHPAWREVSDLVVVSRSPERLAALARRVVHYGKYSWLLLPAGRGEVLKGNWPPPGDPLGADLD